MTHQIIKLSKDFLEIKRELKKRDASGRDWWHFLTVEVSAGEEGLRQVGEGLEVKTSILKVKVSDRTTNSKEIETHHIVEVSVREEGLRHVGEDLQEISLEGHNVK